MKSEFRFAPFLMRCANGLNRLIVLKARQRRRRPHQAIASYPNQLPEKLTSDTCIGRNAAASMGGTAIDRSVNQGVVC